MKKLKLWFLIIISVLLFNNGSTQIIKRNSLLISSNSSNKNLKIKTEKLNNYYVNVLNFIKKHEGFVDSIYFCPGGHRTIGYGHLITKNDTFTNNSKIDTIIANKLLINDYNTALKLTTIYAPQLSGNKRLAIAHFIFAKGIGIYLNSELKYYIDNQLPIDSILLTYCYYTKNNERIFSEYSLNIRKWELEMFKK